MIYLNAFHCANDFPCVVQQHIVCACESRGTMVNGGYSIHTTAPPAMPQYTTTYFMFAIAIGKNDDDIYRLHLKIQFSHSQLFDANKL